MRVRVPSRLQETRVCCNGCIRILEIRGRGSNPPLSTTRSRSVIGNMLDCHSSDCGFDARVLRKNSITAYWCMTPPCHGGDCGFESRWYCEKKGPWLNGLQCHPVTVCGAGSNPVGPAEILYYSVAV